MNRPAWTAAGMAIEMGIINLSATKRLHVVNGPQVAQFMPPAAASGSNWWEAGGATGCVVAYQPKGAASYAASLTDLSGNGNDATEGNAPDWSSSNGWEFTSGNSDYLSSGVNPSREYSLLVRFSNFSNAAFLCGRRTSSGANEFGLIPTGGNGERIARISTTNVQIAGGGITSGVYGFTGYGGDEDAYLDGSVDGSFGTIYTLSGTLPVYIGCCNHNGTANYFCTAYVQAFAIWDNPLVSTAMAAVSTAMAAL